MNQYQRYGDYIVNKREVLGNGKFGVVRRGYRIVHAINRQQDYLEPVAIKESAYDQQNIKEINTLQILNHPNIIKYIDYKISGNSLFMVMELCEGGTLEDLLMRFDLEEDINDQVLYYYSQIVAGIKFMYEKNILHRDLKPSNILVKGDKIKIADFGTSKLKKEDEMIRTLVGTPLFASPQILQQKQSYTQQSDIWSLGVILYLMYHYQRQHEQPFLRLKHSLPWSGKSFMDILQNIKTKPLQFRSPGMPQEVKQIIKRMLKIEAKERMSFKQFFEIELFQSKQKRTKAQLQMRVRAENRMNMSEVDLQLSESCNYEQYELTLINQQTLQPKLLKRQTIDFQLLKLLEMCDSEDHEERQCHQAVRWYQLIREEAEKADSQENYNDLIFQVQFQIYQLLYLKRLLIRQLAMSQRNIRKSSHQSQRKHNNFIQALFQPHQPSIQEELALFLQQKAIQEKYFSLFKRFDMAKATLAQKFTIFTATTNILQKQKQLLSFLTPTDFLVEEMKLILKKKKGIFEKSSEVSGSTSRHEILLIYDLVSLMAFEFSWKMRAQLKRKSKKSGDFLDRYQKERKKINPVQLISRTKMGMQSLKI